MFVWVSHEIKDAKGFMWSMVIEGGGYEQLRPVCAWKNIFVPPKWKRGQALGDISEKKHPQRRQSSAEWAEEIEPNPACSFDASWSQRREANYCFAAFMNCKQQKVVDFEVVSIDPFALRKGLSVTSKALAKQRGPVFYVTSLIVGPSGKRS
jgi:hypothetical protein